MRSTSRRELRRSALVLLALAGLCGVSGAALPGLPETPRYAGHGDPRPRDGGTLVVGIGSNLRTLDPHIAYDSSSITAVRLVYEGLLDYDDAGALVPRLARAMPTRSADGLEIVFSLRADVRFHDGSPFTADDVRASLERLLAHDTGSPGAPFFFSIVGALDYHEGRARHIAGLEVRDAHTVAFRLTSADQTFLNVMAMTFAYPMKVRAGRALRPDEAALGTGPYRLVSWERGVALRFERVRDGREGHRADVIHLHENLGGDLATARFRAGELDILQGASAYDRRWFRERPIFAALRSEQAEVAVSGITLNCELPPLDDVHVRRAIAAAVDRGARVRMANGAIVAAGQALPPALPGHDPDMPEAQRFDLDRARAEMRLAGYPNGLPEPIRLMTTDDPAQRLRAEMLQQDLAHIGIRLEVEPKSFAQYLEETGRRRRSQASFSAWSMDFPDPSNFLDILFHSRSIHDENSENRSFYRNPELDALLDEARSERDGARRIALYARANAIVAEDAPWVFVSYPNTMELWQPYVMNYRPHPIWSLDVRDVWLDRPIRPFAQGARTQSGAAP